MRVRVECYGASARWCGAAQIDLAVADGATAGDAVHLLASRFPDLAARRSAIALARGNEVITLSTPLAEGDALALIPPVSGG